MTGRRAEEAVRGPAPAPVAGISDLEFGRLAELLERTAGIHLRPGKEMLVLSRLSGRVRELGLAAVGGYLDVVQGDASGCELAMMLDLLTTNKTGFFREAKHFELLREEILPALRRRGAPVRIWSAGCATGEEPYSIALCCAEQWPEARRPELAILATDISQRALEHARAGRYAVESLEEVDPAARDRFFGPVPDRPDLLEVREPPRRLVSFARLNLMGPWPMNGPFDLIFCRNVVIYFRRETQRRLARRFRELLRPGGHLLIGHAETLGEPLECGLEFLQPAVYRKPAAADQEE